MASETFKAGGVTAVLNQTEVIKGLDAISDGAASSFLSEARKVMTKIKSEAEAAGPDRTGARERGFRTEERVGADTLASVLLNPVPHAFVARYSVRTEASLDREAATLDPRDEDDLGYGLMLWMMKQRGSEVPLPVLRRAWRKRLTDSHGKGAPNEQIAGKNAWSWHVRRRVRQETDGLIDAVRADLDRLAEAF